MAGKEDEGIDLAIAALQAVKLVRSHYASGGKAPELTREICQMLGGNRNAGPEGDIRWNVADAISKAFLSRPWGGTTVETKEGSERAMPPISYPKNDGVV